jgi:NitT/TauT family transport system substrate-binding protein
MSFSRRTFIQTGLIGSLIGTRFLGTALAQSKRHLRFVMPTTPADYLLPYFVAHDQGSLDVAGIEIDEKVVIGDVNAFRALISDSGDATIPGISPILSGVAGGAKVKIISSWQPIVDYYIVVRKGLPTDIAALGGHSWATYGPGGVTSAIALLTLKKHGLDPAKAKFLSVGDQASRLQAVVSGKVDVTILDSYVTTRAERAGQITPVFPVAQEFPGLGNVFLAVDEKKLADAAFRRDFAALVRAGIEGSRFVMREPDKAADVMMKRLPTGDREVLAETLRRVNKLGVWGVNGGLERSVIDYTVSTYVEQGMLPRMLSYDQLVDTSLVESVIADVGRFS